MIIEHWNTQHIVFCIKALAINRQRALCWRDWLNGYLTVRRVAMAVPDIVDLLSALRRQDENSTDRKELTVPLRVPRGFL